MTARHREVDHLIAELVDVCARLRTFANTDQLGGREPHRTPKAIGATGRMAASESASSRTDRPAPAELLHYPERNER